MQAEKGIIEVDFDGVLGNTHQHLNSYLSTPASPFDGDKDILSWGMQEIGLERRNRVLTLFSDPAFMGSVPLFPEAIFGLDILCRLAESANLGLMVHTHVYSVPVAEARENQLMYIRKTTGIPFDIMVDCGDKKKSVDSLVIIEDNVDNLRNSSALCKVLIRRGHNRSFMADDIGSADYRVVVPDILCGARAVVAWAKNRVLMGGISLYG